MSDLRAKTELSESEMCQMSEDYRRMFDAGATRKMEFLMIGERTYKKDHGVWYLLDAGRHGL